ncbi:MAG TPA: hypothetical protein VGA50_04535 [Kiloniellales bacterium]
MSLRDLISNVKTVYHWTKTVTATETPSTGISRKGFGSVLIQAAIGAVTNIANSPQPSWTLKLEHSAAASSGYAAVAAADVILANGKNDGSITAGVYATIDAAAEDDSIYTIGYIGAKEFLRVVATAANTPGATPIAVIFTLGLPALAPADDG